MVSVLAVTSNARLEVGTRGNDQNSFEPLVKVGAEVLFVAS
jgi:hypothetical protein